MPTIKHFLLGFSLCTLTMSVRTFAADTSNNIFKYPYYVGVEAGYGTTTWSGLVPTGNNKNGAMIISTPTNVEEGGLVGGIFTGIELIPYFAVEANYMRYPNAKVNFGADSLFAFDHNGRTSLNTHTDTLSVMGKFMVLVPRTTVRAYASAGPAFIHRWDELNNNRRVTPTFGLGVNYNINSHIMTELAGNYTAGYGESELNPSEDYMPFLYSVFLRIAYRF
jgi:hypothetical protein